MDRYGPEYGLSRSVYSGLNELTRYGPPPEARTVAVVVGLDLPFLQRRFGSCAVGRPRRVAGVGWRSARVAVTGVARRSSAGFR